MTLGNSSILTIPKNHATDLQNKRKFLKIDNAAEAESLVGNNYEDDIEKRLQHFVQSLSFKTLKYSSLDRIFCKYSTTLRHKLTSNEKKIIFAALNSIIKFQIENAAAKIITSCVSTYNGLKKTRRSEQRNADCVASKAVVECAHEIIGSWLYGCILKRYEKREVAEKTLKKKLLKFKCLFMRLKIYNWVHKNCIQKKSISTICRAVFKYMEKLKNLENISFTSAVAVDNDLNHIVGVCMKDIIFTIIQEKESNAAGVLNSFFKQQTQIRKDTIALNSTKECLDMIVQKVIDSAGLIDVCNIQLAKAKSPILEVDQYKDRLNCVKKQLDELIQNVVDKSSVQELLEKRENACKLMQKVGRNYISQKQKNDQHILLRQLALNFNACKIQIIAKLFIKKRFNAAIIVQNKIRKYISVKRCNIAIEKWKYMYKKSFRKLVIAKFQAECGYLLKQVQRMQRQRLRAKQISAASLIQRTFRKYKMHLSCTQRAFGASGLIPIRLRSNTTHTIHARKKCKGSLELNRVVDNHRRPMKIDQRFKLRSGRLDMLNKKGKKVCASTAMRANQIQNIEAQTNLNRTRIRNRGRTINL